MKRPSFGHGVLVALGIALAAGAAFVSLAPFLGGMTSLRLLVPLMVLAYLLCLLRRSTETETTGRITTLVLWCAVSFAAWLLAPPFPVYVMLHAGMLWLVRSLFFHSSPLSALLDLGLTALGLSAATWALGRSGSLALATWCFFLVQAAFVAVPSRPGLQAAGPLEPGDEAFESARRRAEAALRQLFTH
ncbi:MAG: hypothetical protein JXB36_15865 [Gammaproteobacteria bacterium]|nr:hypothetical protein [Gammaproteobacteria bacterium]